jgi:hypothetical protein
MGTWSKRSLLRALFVATIAVLPTLAAAGTGAEAARASSEKASKDVMQRLFAACPGAKAMLKASEGFATFSGVGAGASGSGVARPTRTRTPAYIQFQSQAAAGGKRDLVFVFQTRDGFSNFAVKGGTLGGAAEAASAGDCSQALAPGVRVIQLEGKKLVGGDVPGASYSRASLD